MILFSMIMLVMRSFFIVLLALLAVSATSAASSPPRAGKPPAAKAPPLKKPAPQGNQALGNAIRPSIEHALNQVKADGHCEAAALALAGVFDQVIAFGDPEDDKALFVEAAFALRLVRLVAAADASARGDLLAYLLANPDLAHTLAFIVKPEREKPAEVLAMLQRLRASHCDTLNTYANLAAAMCVVHDRSLARQINENKVTAPNPVLLFEYFIANEKKMLFGVRSMPAELLIYVVDSVASIPEMQWALQRYGGDANVGNRFFDIEYDYDHYREAKPKKVTAAGYSLPNILKYGGVCADQAHFAVAVGKSIGVPAAYTVGESGTVSHAWVGFVQADRKSAWWNFTTGRYAEYQGVRGTVEDPQTGQRVADSSVSLLADFVGAKPFARQAAAALTDAARRLLKEDDDAIFEPERPAGFESTEPRAATTEEGLALLEAGLKGCPGYAPGWFLVRQLAQDGRLSLDDKKRWGTVLHRLCGERYPDFYLAIVKPMIETIDDVNEQNALWNAAFKVFQNRHDLAASVRMEQGMLWLEHGEPEKAGQCFEDVINRYANAGPFVIDALSAANGILREKGDTRRIVAMYQRAWSQTKQPEDMAGVFVTQSNWFRVGMAYASWLQTAGLDADAAKVMGSLGVK